MSQTHSHKGFTLVEVVIALTILSLIMLTTLTAIRTFADTQTKLQQVTDRLDEMRLVTAFLRRAISQAVPVVRVREEEGYGTYFLGQEDELIWTTPMAGPGFGGLKVLRLSEVDEGQLVLQISDYLSPADEPIWADVERHTLIEHLDSVSLSFRATPAGEWLEQWDWSLSNPYAVKLLISAKSRYWPEMIINLNDGEMHSK